MSTPEGRSIDVFSTPYLATGFMTWMRGSQPLVPREATMLLLNPNADETRTMFPAGPDGAIGALGLYGTGVEGDFVVVNPLETPLEDQTPVVRREGPGLPDDGYGNLVIGRSLWQSAISNEAR